MAPKPAYQKLSTEENDENEVEQTQLEQSEQQTTENTPTTSSSQIPEDAPPPYQPSSDETVSLPPVEEDLLNQSPPLYTDIVKLPTYNESQNIQNEGDERPGLNRIRLFFVANSDQEEITEENVGTDIGFILCFLMSFIFNGLGFIVAYCSTSTLSSHYGAFSGFGLSLVKWAFIVKHRNMLKEYFDGNDWLLYCIILLGWMIFLRGMFAYAQLKRSIYSRARLTRREEEVIE